MKCLVCEKEFEGNACPRCGYPIVEGTDVDALLESLRPQIEEYRRKFERGIRFELGIFRWKESDGSVVLDKKDLMSFGAFPELAGRVSWLPQQFARIPDVQTLSILLRIYHDDTARDFTVPIQNLSDPALQSVGIEVTQNLLFRLKLKNDAGSETASDWLEIP